MRLTEFRKGNFTLSFPYLWNLYSRHNLSVPVCRGWQDMQNTRGSRKEAKTLAGNFPGMWRLEKPRNRWEHINTYLRKYCRWNGRRADLAQDRVRWRELELVVFKLLVRLLVFIKQTSSNMLHENLSRIYIAEHDARASMRQMKNDVVTHLHSPVEYEI
jgi:hypothetical protein